MVRVLARARKKQFYDALTTVPLRGRVRSRVKVRVRVRVL